MACAALLLPIRCPGALSWERLHARDSAWSGDKEVDETFRFHNAGPAPVTITSVQTSCSCTTAEPSKATIAPGEDGEIRAVFFIGNRVGPVIKTITVYTSDSPAAPTELALEVDIRETISCAPALLSWKVGEPPSPKHIDLTVNRPLAVKAVDAVPVTSGFRARVELIADSRLYRLWLTPLSTAAPASVIVSCIVTADGRALPDVPVYAVVTK